MSKRVPGEATVLICTMDPDPTDFREVLRRVRETPHDAIVVDMSTDTQVLRCCEEHGVRCERFVESSGLSDSRNRALALTETDYAVFLDSDAFPEGDWVRPLVTILQRNPEVAIVTPRILAAWEASPPRLLRTWSAGTWMSLLDLGPEPMEVPRVIGTSFAFARSKTPRHGFDIRLGLKPGSALGGEEIKFCLETRAGGYSIRYEPASLVRHRVSSDRGSWPAMVRRIFNAGRERQLLGPTEPLPRRRGIDDHLFRAVAAVPWLAGRSRAWLDARGRS